MSDRRELQWSGRARVFASNLPQSGAIKWERESEGASERTRCLTKCVHFSIRAHFLVRRRRRGRAREENGQREEKTAEQIMRIRKVFSHQWRDYAQPPPRCSAVEKQPVSAKRVEKSDLDGCAAGIVCWCCAATPFSSSQITPQ